MSKNKISPYLKLASLAVFVQWLLVLVSSDLSQESLLCAIGSSGMLFLWWIASKANQYKERGGFFSFMIYAALVAIFLRQFGKTLDLVSPVNRWLIIIPSLLLIGYTFAKAFRRNKVIKQ